jgi:hypothetical protein
MISPSKRFLAALAFLLIIGGLSWWSFGPWPQISPAFPADSQVRSAPISTASSFAVPISVKTHDLEGLVNDPAIIDTSAGGTKQIFLDLPILGRTEVAHVDYNVARGRIELHGAGDRLRFHVPLSAHARLIPTAAQASASGEATGSTTLSVAANFDLAPRIDLRVSLDHADILGISIKSIAERKVKEAIARAKGSLAGRVSSVIDLRRRAEEAWKGLFRTIKIPRTSNVWLRITPTALMLDGPKARDDILTATIVVNATVETFVQAAAPDAAEVTLLPVLTRGPADPRFHVALPIVIDLAELNRVLAARLQDPSRATVSLGDHAVIFREIHVMIRGQRVLLSVGVESDDGFWGSKVEGRLVLGASPQLDRARQELSFDQVDFTAGTTQAFLKPAAWLLSPAVAAAIQHFLKFDLAPRLEEARVTAGEALKDVSLPPPLRLQTRVDELSIDEVSVLGEKLSLVFSGSGLSQVFSADPVPQP